MKLEVFDAVGNENILPRDWEKEIDFAHFWEIRIFLAHSTELQPYSAILAKILGWLGKLS